jgi:hypothetical protein
VHPRLSDGLGGPMLTTSRLMEREFRTFRPNSSPLVGPAVPAGGAQRCGSPAGQPDESSLERLDHANRSPAECPSVRYPTRGEEWS